MHSKKDGDFWKTSEFEEVAKKITQIFHFIFARGWAPATSTNISGRLANGTIAISQSGIDKELFAPENVMLVDQGGAVVAPLKAKPSAETLLHTLVYEKDPLARAVVHTHSVNGTVLSLLHAHQKHLIFQDFEVLKGLKGIQTHEVIHRLPIFPNSQDMVELSKQVKKYWDEEGEIHGFLIAGHGLYTWGQSFEEAKRQVEVYEFLFECLFKLKMMES